MLCLLLGQLVFVAAAWKVQEVVIYSLYFVAYQFVKKIVKKTDELSRVIFSSHDDFDWKNI